MAKNDFSAEAAENYEQKCLCVLVLDVSGSMRGTPIEELNKGLKDFYEEISSDVTTSQRLEISIITFSNTVITLQEPALVENITMPTLTASGSTEMVNALIMPSTWLMRARNGTRRQIRITTARG